MVGILLSYWGGLFSGAMLVSGCVNHCTCRDVAIAISTVQPDILHHQYLRRTISGLEHWTWFKDLSFQVTCSIIFQLLFIWMSYQQRFQFKFFLPGLLLECAKPFNKCDVKLALLIYHQRKLTWNPKIGGGCRCFSFLQENMFRWTGRPAVSFRGCIIYNLEDHSSQ